jgi:hypothetical protein
VRFKKMRVVTGGTDDRSPHIQVDPLHLTGQLFFQSLGMAETGRVGLDNVTAKAEDVRVGAESDVCQPVHASLGFAVVAETAPFALVDLLVWIAICPGSPAVAVETELHRSFRVFSPEKHVNANIFVVARKVTGEAGYSAVLEGPALGHADAFWNPPEGMVVAGERTLPVAAVTEKAKVFFLQLVALLVNMAGDTGYGAVVRVDSGGTDGEREYARHACRKCKH